MPSAKQYSTAAQAFGLQQNSQLDADSTAELAGVKWLTTPVEAINPCHAACSCRSVHSTVAHAFSLQHNHQLDADSTTGLAGFTWLTTAVEAITPCRTACSCASVHSTNDTAQQSPAQLHSPAPCRLCPAMTFLIQQPTA